ncbi:glycerophosphodiester phosphodiesterase family protein [Bacillus sp. P14.5]|uniref:glycerophosphodiester phosphodiesterase n=1 Tax=Bacillus sp. P14.5 TaxID=1983400 RepID=UPI000DE9BD6C|nr:glycerophosphodiester phosphodiesterase family protein [Bacillus sp. P14.5]
MINCTAHRGCSLLAPENTLIAFKKAIDHPAVSMIELDVQLSKDLHPVVIHDFSVDRTTNGKGLVGDHTLEELKKLDAGSWFNSDFSNESIPSLSEVLRLCKGQIKINIELKTLPRYYPQLEEMVAKTILEEGMEKEVMISSFDHQRIKRVKDWLPDTETGLIMMANPVLITQQLKEARASFLSIAHGFITEALVEELLGQDFKLIAWTVNKEVDMKRMRELSEKIMVCTDDVERWSRIQE